MVDLKLGGSSIDALKLGAADVAKVYLGSIPVWQQNIFSPGDLFPAFWFDADDSSTITLATGVSVWANKGSANFNAAQSSGASQPALITGGLNGRNIIRSTASPNTYLQIPETAGLNMSAIFDASGSTVFILKKYISGVVEFKIEQSSGNRLGFEGGNRIDMPNDGSSKIVSDSTTNNWVCMLGWREATQLRLYYNGILKGTQNNNNSFSSAPARMGIGSSAGGTHACQMDVAEILIYPHALSTGEINQVLDYLATKWGIEQAEVNGA